ncbi:MAG: hypothetical protein RI842_05180, partial [Schleiferiaceae bacterium]|nr:hypothetical protein [Schleiferiaceae bacterium]
FISMNAMEWLVCHGQEVLDYETLHREQRNSFAQRLARSSDAANKGATANLLAALTGPLTWRRLPVVYRWLPQIFGLEGCRYVRHYCRHTDYFILPFRGASLTVEVLSSAYPMLWRIPLDYTHAPSLYLFLALLEEERQGRAPVIEGVMVTAVASDPALMIYHPEALQCGLSHRFSQAKRYAGT